MGCEWLFFKYILSFLFSSLFVKESLFFIVCLILNSPCWPVFEALSLRQLISCVYPVYISRPVSFFFLHFSHLRHQMLVFVLPRNFIFMFMWLLWVWSCACIYESLPRCARVPHHAHFSSATALATTSIIDIFGTKHIHFQELSHGEGRCNRSGGEDLTLSPETSQPALIMFHLFIAK